jgi:hypothetical protein
MDERRYLKERCGEFLKGVIVQKLQGYREIYSIECFAYVLSTKAKCISTRGKGRLPMSSGSLGSLLKLESPKYDFQKA